MCTADLMVSSRDSNVDEGHLGLEFGHFHGGIGSWWLCT